MGLRAIQKGLVSPLHLRRRSRRRRCGWQGLLAVPGEVLRAVQGTCGNIRGLWDLLEHFQVESPSWEKGGKLKFLTIQVTARFEEHLEAPLLLSPFVHLLQSLAHSGHLAKHAGIARREMGSLTCLLLS